MPTRTSGRRRHHHSSNDPDPRTDRLAEARRLDAEFKRLLRAGRKAEAEITAVVFELKQRKLYKPLRFTSLHAYCKATAHWSRSKTAKIVALAGKLQVLTHLRAAFFAGDVDWTKAYFASTVATPETDEAWTKDALKLTNKQLERKAALERNETPRSLFHAELTDGQRAHLDEAIARVRAERSEPMPVEQAVAEVARRALAGGETIGGAPREIVIQYCPNCRTATRNGHDGETLTLTEAELEREGCCAPVVDVTGEHEDLSRSIPKRITGFVRRRDGGRCKVPGCERTTHLQYHHEGGWRSVKHDPEAMFLLCSTHHGCRHDGELLIVKLGRGCYSFALADGEELGVIDLRMTPGQRKKLGLEPVSEEFHVEPDGEPEPADDPVELAARFLVKLELGRRDATRLAREAATQLPAEGRTTEAILAAALRALPAPRSAG